MSLTQTYYLAHTARKKLTIQAARADHDLRLLVGHANLLDNLMLELSDTESEREYNHPKPTTRTVEFAEPSAVQDEDEEGWNPEEDVSDADSDVSEDCCDDCGSYDEGNFLVNTHPITIPSRITITEKEVGDDESDDDDDDDEEEIGPVFVDDDEEEEEEDDLEDYGHLSLTRSSSHQSCHPPDLASDSDEESEEDLPPPTTPARHLYGPFDMKPTNVQSTTMHHTSYKSRLAPHSDLGGTVVAAC